MRKTWVRSLGWEDPLEKGKATHSSILAWRIPWTIVHGVAKSQTQLSNSHFTLKINSLTASKNKSKTHHCDINNVFTTAWPSLLTQGDLPEFWTSSLWNDCSMKEPLCPRMMKVQTWSMWVPRNGGVTGNTHAPRVHLTQTQMEDRTWGPRQPQEKGTQWTLRRRCQETVYPLYIHQVAITKKAQS